MFSLFYLYIVRNDNNKDDQSNQSLILVQTMAWWHKVNKPLPGPMATKIYITMSLTQNVLNI